MPTRTAEVKQLSIDDVKGLLNHEATPRISCCFPLHPTGREFQEDPIRLKNQLAQASQELDRQGWREREIVALLEPAWALQGDDDFWIEHGSHGLALYVAPGLFRYHLLPEEPRELLTVADHFHLKPLVKVLVGDGWYHLLALSQNQVQTFIGSRAGIEPIELPEDMPKDMAGAVAGTEISRSLQHHTTRGRGDSGSPEGQIHGHGRPKDESENLLEEFLRQVAGATERWLQDSRTPLIVAGVDHVVADFRAVCQAPQLLDDSVQGNPEPMKADELHEKSWPIARDCFLRELDQAKSRYGDLIGADKTSSELSEIVPAAHHARIETLFAAADREVWGRYDADSQQLTEHSDQRQPGDVDLIGLAVNQTLAGGGWPYVVESESLPEGSKDSGIAATFRW